MYFSLPRILPDKFLDSCPGFLGIHCCIFPVSFVIKILDFEKFEVYTCSSKGFVERASEFSKMPISRGFLAQKVISIPDPSTGVNSSSAEGLL